MYGAIPDSLYEGGVKPVTDPDILSQLESDGEASLVGRAEQLSSGFNKGLSEILGLPVDIIGAVMGKIGINVGTPVGGSDSIKSGFDSAGIKITINPTDTTGRVLERVGEEVGATAVPFAGLFTENLARAHRVSAKIRSGILWINTYRAVSPIAPFGGFGHSGFGREAGMEAILDYTRTQTIWINTASEPMTNPFVMR